MVPLHLYASFEYAEDLDMVLWNRLGEGHQDTGLQSHLTVVLNPEPRKR